MATFNLKQQTAAATNTAASFVDWPFYWEIGNATSVLCSGSVGMSAPDATTIMSVASASKWLYGAYAAQKIALGSDDWKFLNMTSGYNSMDGVCATTDSVDSCLLTGSYDLYTPGTDGLFYYDSAHFQYHAVHRLGVGVDDCGPLAADYNSTLGLTGIQFSQPMLAGGVYTSAQVYRSYLQAILGGRLNIASLLGTHSVPASMLNGAAYSPAPPDGQWHYSVGHWVETDGSFSSAGSFGFYPWISADKSLYGILAVYDTTGNSELGLSWLRRGQAIRHAFQSGRARIVMNAPGSSTFLVPMDWNNANNSIEAVGGGQSGWVATNTNGGRGGDYAARNRMTLVPGARVNVQVGKGAPATAGSAPSQGGDTWFNSTTTLLAKGGGSPSQSVGDVVHAGGGTGSFGGAGAGGPFGQGMASADSTGGNGDAGDGGAGAMATVDGCIGAEWDVTGAGGGGGSSSNEQGSDAGNGGGAGGGGGGAHSGNVAGGGGDGALVITYAPLIPGVPPRAPGHRRPFRRFSFQTSAAGARPIASVETVAQTDSLSHQIGVFMNYIFRISRL